MTTQRREDDSRARSAPEAAAKRDRYKQHLDERLDEALEETFPASDPVSIVVIQSPSGG